MGDDRILINLIAYPLYVLGPGTRVGIWTQGCSLGCQGCMSQHTWEFDTSKEMHIDTILSKLRSYSTRKITISGGEPFEQKNLTQLLIALRKNGYDDILVYSGYDYDALQRSHSEALSYIDALVCGLFEQDNESDKLYKGSDNQELILLRSEHEKQYSSYNKQMKDKRLQRFGSTIVGIPLQKDLRKLHAV